MGSSAKKGGVTFGETMRVTVVIAITQDQMDNKIVREDTEIPSRYTRI